MNTSAKLYSLPFGNVKTYLFALLFVAGNILLPQLCHLLPLGGPTLLPIYFFTLVAAYKFGLRVGLLTAVLSPVVNHLLFAMPAAAVLPAILIKSTLLAVAASIVARRPRTRCCSEACSLPYWPIRLLAQASSGCSAATSTWLHKISESAYRACCSSGWAVTGCSVPWPANKSSERLPLLKRSLFRTAGGL